MCKHKNEKKTKKKKRLTEIHMEMRICVDCPAECASVNDQELTISIYTLHVGVVCFACALVCSRACVCVLAYGTRCAYQCLFAL